MNRVIFHELNIIRFNERARILNSALAKLRNIKKNDPSHVSENLINEFASINQEAYPDNNHLIAFENYDKLEKVLTHYTSKSKKINSDLLVIKEKLQHIQNSFRYKAVHYFNNRARRLLKKKVKKGLIEELQASIKTIKKELDDLNPKIKDLLPGQYILKPLDPFYFLNKDIKVNKSMISIIVLNDNGADHLIDLFDSFINRNTYENYEILVMDRKSDDNSPDIIKRYQDKLPLKTITCVRKYTVSYLNNLAVDSCHGEFLLFLNSKTIIKDNILPLFLSYINRVASDGIIGASIAAEGHENLAEKHEYFGGIGFMIGEVKGQPDIINPIIDPDFLVNGGVDVSIKNFRKKEGVFIKPGTWLTCLMPVVFRGNKNSGMMTVPAVSGSALFCRRADFLQAGGFDLNFFNGYEDIDLCLKFASALNKKSIVAPDIRVSLNVENVLTEINPSDESMGYYNLGVLLNKHGYFIKDRYLDDLIHKKQQWTKDSAEKLKESGRLVQSLMPEAKDRKEIDESALTDTIITGYLKYFSDKKLRIAIKIAAYNDDRLEFWGDYHFANSLKKAFIRKGHPTRIDTFESWHDSSYLADDVVVVLRGIKKYQTRGSQINILWNISHPEHIDESEYREYDHIFVASNVFADELKAKFSIHAEKLLQCTEPELFYHDTTEIKDDEKTDILYVANSRGVMRKAMEFTMKKGIPVAIYGTNWEKFLPAEMIKGNYIKNEKLRRYYSNCNILLNDHWPDMVQSGFISNRIFDALACGAIILTDPVNGIEQTFSEGIYFYRDADELGEQVAWIRGHFDEAKQLALQNCAIVLANHTFDHRAERILEVALQIHRLKT